MDIKTQIRSYISKNLLYSDNGFNYSDDVSFLEEGIIDSIGVMELVSYVEENFNVPVRDQDVTPDNFDSINRLADFIHRNSN
jgi:acyl carrier protein